MAGWIKFHRSVLDWEWYGDPNVVLVFIDLLLNATHTAKNYRGHTLKPGDIIWGRIAASDRIGISQQQVRTALEKLQLTSEITIKTTNKFSIISIVSWEKYQADNQQINQPITNDQPTSNQQVTTSKEGKKVKREEDITLFDDFWLQYPRQRRGAKGKAEKAYRRVLTERRGTESKILEGTLKYSASDEVARGFAKGAEAWLNNDGWTNDYSITANRNTNQLSDAELDGAVLRGFGLQGPKKAGNLAS